MAVVVGWLVGSIRQSPGCRCEPGGAVAPRRASSPAARDSRALGVPGRGSPAPRRAGQPSAPPSPEPESPPAGTSTRALGAATRWAATPAQRRHRGEGAGARKPGAGRRTCRTERRTPGGLRAGSISQSSSPGSGRGRPRRRARRLPPPSRTQCPPAPPPPPSPGARGRPAAAATPTQRRHRGEGAGARKPGRNVPGGRRDGRPAGRERGGVYQSVPGAASPRPRSAAPARPESTCTIVPAAPTGGVGGARVRLAYLGGSSERDAPRVGQHSVTNRQPPTDLAPPPSSQIRLTSCGPSPA